MTQQVDSRYQNYQQAHQDDLLLNLELRQVIFDNTTHPHINAPLGATTGTWLRQVKSTSNNDETSFDGPGKEIFPTIYLYVQELFSCERWCNSTIDGGINWNGWQSETVQNLSQFIEQNGHGFSLHDQVYQSTIGIWGKALANAANTLAQGSVSKIIDLNRFVITFYGIVDYPSHGFGSAIQYLSPDTAGAVVNPAPNSLGDHVQPRFVPYGPDLVKVVDQLPYFIE